ncbi:dynamin-related protein 3B-like [Amaranthus tricolor]|uniref:dynamin-related protein 3B-like n=1 Tax=Amaranthus tricolor TaxID=29722 RepID=UPI00258C266F|nr:dynamin-related protein 3B-like [Amaranthus tricolor]
MNHFCESRELQRFPAFQKRLEAVMLNFLYDAMKPVEKRSLESIVMEADDINTSHPNFVGGQKAIELAKQRIRSSKGTQNSTEHDRSTGMCLVECRRMLVLSSYAHIVDITI